MVGRSHLIFTLGRISRGFNYSQFNNRKVEALILEPKAGFGLDDLRNIICRGVTDFCGNCDGGGPNLEGKYFLCSKARWLGGERILYVQIQIYVLGRRDPAGRIRAD